ncbi:MAG: DUF2934 domain-containing protein [Deltaproteobacteria bacterium]|nr:DUF2934 domain-containing protein [Deltaproteobacteria bacterium]MBN2673809.1 DUF2934 domain-containing protein [Deltaproteobacteria bacterium]
MTTLATPNQLYLVSDIEDDDVLQLRQQPAPELEIQYEIEIQSRIQETVSNSRHAKVSLAAYSLWQKKGCPKKGDTLKNWIDAEKLIASETKYRSMQ